MTKTKKTASGLREMMLAALQASGFSTAHDVTIKRTQQAAAGHTWEIDIVTLTEHAENIRMLTRAAEIEMRLQALYDLAEDA